MRALRAATHSLALIAVDGDIGECFLRLKPGKHALPRDFLALSGATEGVGGDTGGREGLEYGSPA
jgi:hypothetical protein